MKKKAANTIGVVREKVRTKAEVLKAKTHRAVKELQNTTSPKTATGKKKS
ncbi:MAG: hypothetical protein NT061_09050 [Spirochaetes bacterium]|nr:hypothetical protein [Spirochaetota bacterium]